MGLYPGPALGTPCGGLQDEKGAVMPERRANPFGFEQLFGWLKPSPQLGAVTERAMESVDQVSRLLSETAEAVMRKQTRLMTGGMSSIVASMQQLPTLRTPQDLLNAQAAAFRAGMETAVTNMRDMSEIWQRCSSGMADLWLQSLASNGEAAPNEQPPGPLRKAAE